MRSFLKIACSFLILFYGGGKQLAHAASEAISSEEVPTGFYYIKSTQTSLFGVTNPCIAAASETAMNLVAFNESDETKTNLWYIIRRGAGADNGPTKYYIRNISNNQYFFNGEGCPLGNDNSVGRWFSLVYNAEKGGYTIANHPDDDSFGDAGGFIAPTSATAFTREATAGDNAYWQLVPVEHNIETSTHETPKFYTIKAYRQDNGGDNKGAYVNYNGDNASLQRSAKITTLGYWYFVAEGNGVKIYNKYAGTEKALESVDKFSASGATWHIKTNPYNPTPTFCISKSENLSDNCWDSNNTNDGVGSWAPGVDDYKGTSWNIEPVTINEARVEMTPEFTTDEANPIYYRIKNARSNKYATYNGDTGQLKQYDGDELNPNMLWYFTPEDNNFNPQSGAKLHNAATTLKLADTKTNTFSEEGITWYILPNPYREDGFCISKNRNLDGNNNWDEQDNHENIGYWYTNNEGGNADGTNWELERVNTNASTMTTDWKETKKYGTGYVGSVRATDELNQKIEVATNMPGYVALFNTPSEIVTLDPAKFYNIIFKRGTSYMGNYDSYANKGGSISDDDDARKVETSQSPNAMAAIWQFADAGNGNHYITSANAAKSVNAEGNVTRIGKVENSSLKVSQYPGGWGTYQIANGNTNYEKLLIDANVTDNNKYLNCFFNPGSNTSQAIGLWKDGANDAGNIVYIKEVEEIVLTVSDAKWASVHYPFAVKIPAGLTVYTATRVNEQNQLELANLEGEVLPAYTPVLVAGEAGDYAMEILHNNTDVAPESNILDGSTIRQKGWAEERYYALSRSNGTVMLMRTASSVEAVPANKAYIPGSEVTFTSETAAKGLAFTYGETTDINHASIEKGEATEYYDLNGRRVLYPANGIYVTNTGKKVFIK